MFIVIDLILLTDYFLWATKIQILTDNSFRQLCGYIVFETDNRI